MFIYLYLKRIGYRAGMPEWSKGPDSSKICFLTKFKISGRQRLRGFEPHFQHFFFAPFTRLCVPEN